MICDWSVVYFFLEFKKKYTTDQSHRFVTVTNHLLLCEI